MREKVHTGWCITAWSQQCVDVCFVILQPSVAKISIYCTYRSNAKRAKWAASTILSEAGIGLHTDGHTQYSLMFAICASSSGYGYWPLEVNLSTPEVLLSSRRTQTLLQRRIIFFSQRGMTILGRGHRLKLISKYVVFVTDLFKLPACILDISKVRMGLKDRSLAVEGSLSTIRVRHTSHI